MSRYFGPRLRIVRRLGELPGLTAKIPKKQNPPGQHGPNQGGRKRKLSQYNVRLKEKQKLRFHYGITESQLLRYVRKARQSKGSTGELLLQLLEMRLDSVVFRLGMAPTIAAARQLVSHGHIRLNAQKVTIPSYQCEQQDKISVVQKKHSQQVVTTNLETARPLPGHLTFQKENLEGIVTKIADRESIGLKVNELLIVEFYSRKV
uniref:ribosomal protein S4 n=1 Tax=Massjukichlorella minus TaxID=2650457 RepID=UPI002410FCFE|nr:ribosomal protein S4 [Massjukichlorella minus]WDY13015.1 ribosomal protein S4 [Massjukichlorella minus]